MNSYFGENLNMYMLPPQTACLLVCAVEYVGNGLNISCIQVGHLQYNVYMNDKGELLFSSVEQVEVLVSNLKFGPSFVMGVHCIIFLPQLRFEGIFGFACVTFPKKYCFVPIYFFKPKYLT